MANQHTSFWFALLAQEQCIRLWNGYLGWKLAPTLPTEEEQHHWPKLVIAPPDGGWPELNEEETEAIATLADEHGGFPVLSSKHDYMDFSDETFSDEADFSGLVLVSAHFKRTRFQKRVKFSQESRLYAESSFRHAVFEGGIFCDKTRFYARAYFDAARFKSGTTFLGAQFMGGASFTGAVFENNVMFNDSRFEERDYSSSITVPHLTDFTGAKFKARTSFREVLFGNPDTVYSRTLWPARRADFSDTQFMAATDFRGASFGGVPCFFNAELHEDTDFGGVDWTKAETDHIPIDYAIRAWERLELMMSKLDKPFDRHRFFRLKMRARRRLDGHFLRFLSWLFEVLADYGWGVRRAFCWWFGHWTGAGVILLVNSRPESRATEVWTLCSAALGTGFSNAHAFLRLTASGGYLEEGRRLLEQNDTWGLLNVVGTAQTVLGPVFLFFLLLTLRNRFRLA